MLNGDFHNIVDRSLAIVMRTAWISRTSTSPNSRHTNYSLPSIDTFFFGYNSVLALRFPFIHQQVRIRWISYNPTFPQRAPKHLTGSGADLFRGLKHPTRSSGFETMEQASSCITPLSQKRLKLFSNPTQNETLTHRTQRSEMWEKPRAVRLVPISTCAAAFNENPEPMNEEIVYGWLAMTNMLWTSFFGFFWKTWSCYIGLW